MGWAFLMLMAGLWLVSPVILLISLIVTRRRLQDARRQVAAARAIKPESARTSGAVCPSSAEVSLGSPTPTLEPPNVEPLTLDLEDLAPRDFASPSSAIPAPRHPSPQAPNLPGPNAESPVTPAWRRRAPSPLEKALRQMSGWPRLIAPFLAQNIGWFIGAFCFVSGALFLIANTSGFVNAMVVFASLVAATAFLLWAGYRFRRKGAELVVASSMLLTLAMLLAPLDVAMAVRLIGAGDGDGLLLTVALSMTLLTLAGFAGAAALSSALMDRALLGPYPWLLTALAAVQLAAPLARFQPDWSGLAAFHVVLLAVLGYGLWRFAHEWLQRLFVDRRLTTYYAAGLLVYTALVSFIHLTWIWPQPLPPGYAGPFLMALCGLLFPLDAAFKDWVHKYAFLSRFSFALYALSIVAIAISIQSTPALLLTLALGTVLYAWMTWRYRTWPPLSLLLGCMAGLYGLVLLARLPPAWHELASLPGLVTLLMLARGTTSRAPSLARQCLLACGGLLIGLTAWSLFWSSPGWLAFVTALTAALILGGAARLGLALPETDPRWVFADAGVVVLASAAVAYAPAWMHLSWTLRTAFGLLALAALWTGLGLRVHWPLSAHRRVWIAAALASVALGLMLGGLALWTVPLGRLEPLVLLALAGAVLLWLGLGLRRQVLIYGVLILVAGIGALIKQGYFPGPSTGTIEFLVVLALWSWLAWLGWHDRRRQTLASLIADVDRAPAPPPLTVLIRAPLEQSMALLWVLGLTHLSLRLLGGTLGVSLPVVVGLAVLSGLLLIGHFHRYRWVALPFLLGLAGLMVQLDQMGWTPPWLSAAAVLSALLIWRASVGALARPLTWRLAEIVGFTTPGGAGGRRQVEASLHACALIIAAVPVVISAVLALSGTSAADWWLALSLSLLLFILTGRHHSWPFHAYAALVTLTLGLWLMVAWLAPALPLGFGQPLALALLLLWLNLLFLLGPPSSSRGPRLARWLGWRGRCPGRAAVLAPVRPAGDADLGAGAGGGRLVAERRAADGRRPGVGGHGLPAGTDGRPCV